MKARKIRVIAAGFVAAMAVSAAAPVMADELTSPPAVYAMSSTVRTIINGQEYTRETAYSRSGTISTIISIRTAILTLKR